jgi:DNA-binding winged helix-turn-helix (wHTH) protein
MFYEETEKNQFKKAFFGPFILDNCSQTLKVDDTLVKVEPLIFELLVYFMLNPKRVISRDELGEKIWQQEFVDNNSINRAISELRRILSHEALPKNVIKTHYRKGYSFNYDVKFDPQGILDSFRGSLTVFTRHYVQMFSLLLLLIAIQLGRHF